MMNQEIRSTLALTVFFTVFGFWLQGLWPVSGDVGYLLYAAHQMLAGGHYAVDFFETNPPMILYVYAPVWWVQTLFKLDIVTAVRGCVFLLAIISAWVSLILLKKPLAKPFYHFKYFFHIIIFFVLFILPFHDFGQREHLFLIAFLPYVFLKIRRAENYSISTGAAFFIGFFAGVGLSLKPFFLLPWILIEGYFLLAIKKRRILIESFAIILVFIFYSVLLYFFEPQYAHTVLPQVFRHYFPYSKQTAPEFFSPPYVLFCFAMVVSYIFGYRYDRDRHFGTVLWLGLVGLVGAFCLARTSWSYHVLPAFALAYLLASYYIVQWAPSAAIAFVVGIFIFSAPIYNHYGMWRYWSSTLGQAQAITDYIRAQPGTHSLACFPLGTTDCFPLVYRTESQYCTRFPSLWWYKSVFGPHGRAEDQAYFVDQMAQDFERYQPHFVLFNSSIFSVRDMLFYFSGQPSFQHVWKNYHYKTTINHYQIYERIAS